MSVSVREKVLRQVVAQLAEGSFPAKAVYRSRLDQIEQAELPCFDVSPGEEKVSLDGFAARGDIERTLPVVVRAIIDASTQGGANGEQEDAVADDGGLDPFYVYAVKQLTDGASNLGGLVDDFIELGSKVVFRPAGRNIIGLEINFEAQFSTKRGDPTRGV